MTELNVSSGMVGLNAISMTPAFGWAITTAIFIGILGIIYILSKNFRQFLYGAVISTILLINYNISRFVGVTATEGDWIPLKTIGKVIAFIVVSVVIGKWIQKFNWVKKLEEKVSEREKTSDEIANQQ